MRGPFSFHEGTEDDEGIHRQVGRAVAVAVRFEENCRALETLATARESAAEEYASDAERDRAMMDAVHTVWHRRLGRRPQSIAARYLEKLDLPALEATLKAGVEARNRIAHEVASGLCDGISIVQEWRSAHLELLRLVTTQVAEADRVVSLLVLMESGETPPTKATYDEYPSRAVEWVLSE